MFGSLGAPELIVIGVVLILLFGVGKLSGLGKDLGSSVKEFRKAIKDEDAQPPEQKATTQPIQQPPAAPQTPPAQQPGDPQKPNVF
jgi:sec-independent protein translocase protein TatA